MTRTTTACSSTPCIDSQSLRRSRHVRRPKSFLALPLLLAFVLLAPAHAIATPLWTPGDLLVSDNGNPAIYVIAPDGTLVNTITTNGFTPGELGLAFNSSGDLFVTDLNNQIHEITPAGTQSDTSPPASQITIFTAPK